jgi:hypothetical protein
MRQFVVRYLHPGEHGAVGADDGHRYDTVSEVILDLPGLSDHSAAPARQFATAWGGPPYVVETPWRLLLNERGTLKLSNGRRYAGEVRDGNGGSPLYAICICNADVWIILTTGSLYLTRLRGKIQRRC